MDPPNRLIDLEFERDRFNHFHDHLMEFRDSMEKMNVDVLGSLADMESLLYDHYPQESAEGSTAVEICDFLLNVVFKPNSHRRSVTSFRDYLPLFISFAAIHSGEEAFKQVLHEFELRLLLDAKKDSENMETSGHGSRSMVLMRRYFSSPIKEPTVLNTQDRSGRTALHYAVQAQCQKAVRLLVNLGADVNAANKHRFTPLHDAARLQNHEIVKILLDGGAEPNVWSLYLGDAPLNFVCGFPKPDAGTHKQEDGIARFNAGIVKLLVENGADINVISGYGMTPLHEACKMGRLDVVRFLLSLGADVHSRDNSYNTALHHAVCSRNVELVEFLLRIGSDIEAVNIFEDTPLLHLLCWITPASCKEEAKIKMLELLLDYGANVNVRSGHLNCNVVHTALLTTQVNATVLLLEFNADFEDQRYYEYPIVLRLISDFRMMGVFDLIRKTFNDPDAERAIKLLVAYIALRKKHLANLLPNCSNPPEFDYVDSIFRGCKLELEQMKVTKISEKHWVSFYHVLTFNFFKMFRVSQNEDLMRCLDSFEYEKKFPLYALSLKTRLERIKSLRVSVKKTLGFLKKKWKGLPLLVLEMILSYLQPSDFRNFGEAFVIELESVTLARKSFSPEPKNSNTLALEELDVIADLKKITVNRNGLFYVFPHFEQYGSNLSIESILDAQGDLRLFE